mmetsp:Transcript_108164/g.349181  ORF Transcript_108164/g.349181 Transcript_108164/m.349181 type:complete len:336 (+) Transcript_108164:234-1241(+)
MAKKRMCGAADSPLRGQELLPRAQLRRVQLRAHYAPAGAGVQGAAIGVHEDGEWKRPAVHRAAVPPVQECGGLTLASECAARRGLCALERVDASPGGPEPRVDAGRAAVPWAWRGALHVAAPARAVAAGLGQEGRRGQAPVRDRVGVGGVGLDALHRALVGHPGPNLQHPDRLSAAVAHAEAPRAVPGAPLGLPAYGPLAAVGAEHPLIPRDGRALPQAHAVVVGVAVGAPALPRLAARVNGSDIRCVLDRVPGGIATLRSAEVAGAAVLLCIGEAAGGRGAAKQAPAPLHSQVIGAWPREPLLLQDRATSPRCRRAPSPQGLLWQRHCRGVLDA